METGHKIIKQTICKNQFILKETYKSKLGMEKRPTASIPKPFLIIRNITTYIFKQLVDIHYFNYRLLVGNHWNNVCSILIYEMVSFFLGRARILSYWGRRRDIENIIIKYTPVFPIKKSKIAYNSNSRTEKTYSAIHCEDFSLKGSLNLALSKFRVLKEIIDQTLPLLYYWLLVVMLAPLLILAVDIILFGKNYYMSEIIAFVFKGYIYLFLLSSVLSLIAIYTRVSDVMEKRSAFKYAIQVTLASIIIFPIFAVLSVVHLIYFAVSLTNRMVLFIKSGIRFVTRVIKSKKFKSKKSLGSLAINNKQDLFDGIVLSDILTGTLSNIEVLEIYSKRVQSIVSAFKDNNEYIKDFLRNHKLNYSVSAIKREALINELQLFWRQGIVSLMFELNHIAVSGLKNQLNNLTDPQKAGQNPMSAFALAVLENKSRYIFLFIISLPVLILTRNLLRLFFPWPTTYLIYPSDLQAEKEFYDKYKEAFERYCTIEKGCIMFSHVYLPDFGFKGNLHDRDSI